MKPALMVELEAAGVELRVKDGKLVASAAPGALTPDLKARVTPEVKADLIAWLRGDAVLCHACCRICADGQPVGQGAVWLDGALYHIATCLPRAYCYNRETGKTEARQEAAA